MPKFESGLIERLSEKYPQLDVRALAGSVGHGASNPSAVLVSICKNAARADKSSVHEEKEEIPEYAGYFSPDGSWIFTENVSDYWSALPGSVTRGVRQLVWLCRNTDLSPKQAAMEIEARPHLHRAFPLRAFWLDIDLWARVPVSTSAEDAVKRHGDGRLHRWPYDPNQVDPAVARYLVRDLQEKIGPILSLNPPTFPAAPDLRPANEDYFRKILKNPGEPPELTLNPDA